MKILMLVPFLPNTSMSGGQTRWYNIIKLLSKEHDITLFTLIKDDSERKHIPELEKYCKKVRVFYRSKSPWTLRNIFLAIFSYYPLLVVRNWSPKEKRAIQKELESESYDLIHAETFYVMPHIPETKVPTIMVEQTIEYLVYKHYVDNEVFLPLRPFLMIDVLKLRYWEKFFWKKADQLVAVSEEDKKIMQKLIPGISVDVIPNGVDSQSFLSHKVARKKPPRVLYGAANFKWLQNVEAVEILVDKVWPKIHKSYPEAKLWIVGKDIPEKIVNLSKVTDYIETTESIADVRDAYKAASIMMVPVRGPGGTRLKVLEAMAAGLPVVSTKVGAAGLGLEHNKHALIADSPGALAKATMRLLASKKLSKRIGSNGQKYVEKNFDWRAFVKLHNNMYNKLVNEKN